MRHTEFWARLEGALPQGYAGVWADQHVLSGLGGLTVTEALDSGYTPKEVWRAVHTALDLPASER